METGNWGGRRLNSGRKKKNKVQLAVYVSKDTAEKIRMAAKEKGCTLSEYVEERLA